MSLISFFIVKNETKYSKSYFFPILRNKSKLMMNVRFRISLWEIRMAVWVQLSKFSISLQKKNKCPFGCSFQNFVFRCKKNKWLFGNNCKISYFAIKKQMAAWVHTLRHFKKMVTHSQNIFIGFIKTF